ncbi:hypothetical protein [Tardiphaga robiniae]|nr:hypothetical protein [Tardiphaga robiniae]
MPASNAVTVEALSPTSFEPFGWVLGKTDPLKKDAVGFRSPASDF